MKKMTVLLTVLLAAVGALADEKTQNNLLTIAALEANAKAAWVETEEDAQLRLSEELAEKTEALTAKINAKLEKQLEEKISKDLGI